MRAKIWGMNDTVKQDAIVSVAIVENDAETRAGWVKLLEGHPRIKCVAACESGEAALRRIPDCRPRVVLMDINMPEMSGIRCTALLKQLLPKTQILMLTAYSHNEYIFEALKAGASGYLLKSISPDELISSILDVVDGGAPMTGQIARRVIAAFRTPAPKGLANAQLTSREIEILERLAKGYSNKDIASHLGCSTPTVRTHLQHIYEKLHVHCRTQAVAKYWGDPASATRAAGARR